MSETQILNAEDCHTVLQKFLKSRNFQLKSFKIVNFHNPLQGLVGEHFTLKVEYEYQDKQQSQTFFVKTLSGNPGMLHFSKSIQVYEKEEFFFKLLDEYEKYNIDTSFAPEGLFFKPYVIVLEDLSQQYRGTPKRQLLDLEHCQSSLEAIAKFHASSIIYEKRKEKELGQKFSLNDVYSEILEDKLMTKEESLGRQWMMVSIQGLFHLIDLIPENHVTHDEFKNKLGDILSVGSIDGLISGILHADLWTSNLLHSYKNNKPVDSKLVDFQLVKYGPLELDVVEFLMTNTTRACRDDNFEKLVAHYYEKLREVLIGAGLNCDEILPPVIEFVRSCDSFKLIGKIHAIVDHSYTFVADEIYAEALKSEKGFKSFFEERGKWILDSYNNNEEFKNVLTEDVTELRDLLFP